MAFERVAPASGWMVMKTVLTAQYGRGRSIHSATNSATSAAAQTLRANTQSRQPAESLQMVHDRRVNLQPAFPACQGVAPLHPRWVLRPIHEAKRPPVRWSVPKQLADL